MLYYLGEALSTVWGPFRLFSSFFMLLGIGAFLGACAMFYLLPRRWDLLPRDRGRAHTPGAAAAVARGKPTGAGLLFALAMMPVLLLVLPCTVQLLSVLGCLLVAMATGYLDDRSETPWGDYRKGFLDLGVAALAALAFSQAQPVTMWLPLVKGDFVVPLYVFLPLATLLLWMTINATNCTDGVDGLAGTLTLLSMFYLAAFLYLVVGHKDNAAHLLVTHNPDGARWAILLTSTAGGLAAYLWYNAEPSRVLMGDAGSRYLGLLIGMAVLASGNPFLIVVVAPVVLINGGSGIVKIALLRCLRRMGVDIRSPQQRREAAPEIDAQAHPIVALLHRVRFPLHDHFRKNLGWSNAQVLLRFVLIQMFVTPILFGLLVKVR